MAEPCSRTTEGVGGIEVPERLFVSKDTLRDTGVLSTRAFEVSPDGGRRAEVSGAGSALTILSMRD